MIIHRKSIQAIVVALAAFSSLLAGGEALASGATSQRDINPTGGVLTNASDGLRWWVGSNSQFQVNLGNQGQVYSPSGRPNSGSIFNSVYLRVDRGTNAATRLYHGSNTNSGNSNANANLAFTQVSQSGISGSGTAASPWQVTTVLTPAAPDNGITVTIVDSYVRPQSWLTRRVTLSGMPATGASIKFYQNVDTYLQGGDAGAGFTRTSAWNSSGVPDLVGVVKGDQFEALWYEPSSGTPHWNRYSSESYLHPARQMCRGDNSSGAGQCTTGTGNLLNTIDPSANTDNGMAAQWDIPAGSSTFTMEYRITFAMGAVDLNKSFAPATINAGGVSTLTFSLSNRTTNAVASINFTDTLPTGVVVAPSPNVRTSCPAGGTLGTTLPAGMTVTAAAGAGTIQVTGGRVNGATGGSDLTCLVAVDVTSNVVGQHANTTGSMSGLNNVVNLVGNEVLTVVQPQLSVTKTVGNALVAGQTGTASDGHYLIALTNTGTGATSLPIQLNDALPAGVTAVAVSSAQGTVNCGTLPSAGPLACTFTPSAPIAANGGTATIRMNVAIASSLTGTVTNVVGVAGGGDPDPMPTCPADGNPQCGQVSTALNRVSDLQITKTNNADALSAGQQTVYTIVVSNAGPSDANGAVVRDPASPGLSCTAAACGSAANGAVCPATSIASLQGTGVVLGTFPAGGSLTFTLTCTVQ